MTKKTKIRTIHELPEWFDLSHYKDLASYSAKELRDDVRRRHDLYHNDICSLDEKKRRFWDIEDYPLSRHFPSEEGKSYSEWCSFFRSSPNYGEKSIKPVKKSIPVKAQKDEEYQSRDKHFDIIADMWDNSPLRYTGSTVIRPAQLLDAIRAIDDDTDLRGFKLETGQGMGSLTRYDDLLKSTDRQSIAIQIVNYNATDQQLKDAFENLLPLYRKHLGVPEPTKKVTDGKVQDLKTSPVIPFIDLMLWAELYDCEITDSVYASVLYPDGRYDSNKIRLSTRPSAKAVLEPQFMGALNELAAQEREAEREKI